VFYPTLTYLDHKGRFIYAHYLAKASKQRRPGLGL